MKKPDLRLALTSTDILLMLDYVSNDHSRFCRLFDFMGHIAEPGRKNRRKKIHIVELGKKFA